MTMLDEKDKLMDDLQKAKEDYDKISRKLAESQADKEALLRQLKVLLPQVCVRVCVHVYMNAVCDVVCAYLLYSWLYGGGGTVRAGFFCYSQLTWSVW